MEAARPRGRDRRLRRGTVDRPLNTRLVRLAFVVVVPALLALLFSVSTTGTLPRSSLEPLFDANAAATLAQTLSTEYPTRVPGTLEAEGGTRWYRETISALGLATEEDVWNADLADLGPVELRNVITVVPGRSPEAIVLVAHRDNAGAVVPLSDNAAGTAALIELARGFAPQEAGPNPQPQRTIVLVSTDGGAFGGAGAARFVETSPFADDTIAVVVLDGLGRAGRPQIAIAGDTPASPARALVTTTSARVREQTGAAPSLPSVATQLVDLGVPFAFDEQGRFLSRGIAAITLTTQARDSALRSDRPLPPLSVQRLGQLGRAAEALVGSLDISVGGAFRTPDSVFFGDRAASGWTVRLSLVLAVVPFALGVVDLLARSRRRRLPFAPAMRGLRARLFFWLYGGLLLWVGGLTGALPTGEPLPLPPHTSLVVDVPVAGLGVLALAFALGWLIGRRRLVPTRATDAEERIAGLAVALALLVVVSVTLVVIKPYALVFVLPSMYAWLWIPLEGRSASRIALFVAGLSGPLLGLALVAQEVGLSVLEAPLYFMGLVSVGYVSAGSALLAVAWTAAAAQVAALAFGRYAPYAEGLEPPPAGLVRSTVHRLARARAR